MESMVSKQSGRSGAALALFVHELTLRHALFGLGHALQARMPARVTSGSKEDAMRDRVANGCLERQASV